MPPAPKSLPGLSADYLPQFFTGDLVAKKTDPRAHARVLRCWSEEDEMPPLGLEPGQEAHPLDRPLLRGEIGVSSTFHQELAILPESAFVLVQRDFMNGDLVKRSLTAVESAMVIGVETEVQLDHVLGIFKIDGWTPTEKVRNAMNIEARSRVVYDNWVGVVEEVFEAGQVEQQGGQVYWLGGSRGMLEIGRRVSELFAPPETLPVLPASADPDTDLVVDIRPLVVFVSWHAINQELPISEQDQHPEPPRFWHGMDIEKLTVHDTFFNSPIQLGATVRFRKESDAPPFPAWFSYSFFALASRFSASPADRVRDLPIYRITEVRSKVKLRWQDGKVTEEMSSAIVPYQNVDDYESWPGDTLVWRDENGNRRPACVQTFNPHQRVADLLFLDDNTKSTVSVLELDPGGGPESSYGLDIGQTVLFSPDNGSNLPEVPALGHPSPTSDAVHAELDRLTMLYSGKIDPPALHIPQGDLSLIRWFGEVCELHLDGTASVRLPGGDVRRVGVKQLVALNDPPPIAEEMAAMGLEMGMDMDMAIDAMDMLDEDGRYVGSDGSWMTEPDGDSDGAPEVVDLDIDMPESERDAEEVDPMVSDDAAEIHPDELAVDRAIPSLEEPESGGSSEAGPSRAVRTGRSAVSLLGDEAWQSFDVLETAPPDHHYISETRSAPPKAYLTRLQREHRTLMTSLPENILVRTYEDRSDLLRVLIIGPQHTPYVDAPFVFDVHLNPAKFPNEPPAVFFHSHTNGHGRCNPNLYEDGKVCLSVLGTWAGERSESWDPKNSSLLQVFVSISGLVLVRHPYHCEPAFAKLEGTREGQINSLVRRLYSEKAYVLSRNFVRQALQTPPEGFAAEIKHFYVEKARLQTVIDHAKALMDKGESAAEATGGDLDEMWSQDAMGSLTMGAILSLKRTVTALESIAAQLPE